ncbi:MAG: AsnC family transcriptional regulator [Desulfobacterales bacterium]|nr:AsnC family transcriptional regulator [Desulfobacterales bacterium]
MFKFDDIDKKILNRIQSAFPITERPYLSIAKELGLSEKLVIEKIKNLKEKGIIRRIGANFVPEKLGFVSTLCAAKVPVNNISEFSKTVNSYEGVTHNYLRDHEYNVWFTFIAKSEEEIAENLKKISEETGIESILNLPAINVYKVRAQFDI